MKLGSLLKMFALCALAAAACSLGCAHTMSSESTQVRQVAWQADLDEYQEVVLSVSRVYDSESGEVVGRHDDLVLEVRPRPSLHYDALLKSLELRSHGRTDELRYDDIEIRADESRRRVWFIEVSTQRVIATLDRDTRVTTGPDEAPPWWATPDGGVLLEPGR